MRPTIFILQCLFVLGYSFQTLDLGFTAYSGSELTTALQSNNYGYFSSSGSVLKIDLDTFSVAATDYFSYDITYSEQFMYNGNIYFIGDTQLVKYNPSNLNKISETNLPISSQQYVARSVLLGKYLYMGVGDGSAFEILKYDLTTLEVISSKSTNASKSWPRPCFSYGSYIFVKFHDATISQYDANTLNLIATMDLSTYASSSFGWDPTTQFEQYGYITTAKKWLIKIDLSTFTIVTTQKFDDVIDALTIQDSNSGFLLMYGDIVKFNCSTLTQTDSIVTMTTSGSPLMFSYENSLIVTELIQHVVDSTGHASISNIGKIDLSTKEVTDYISLLSNGSDPLTKSVYANGYGYYVSPSLPNEIVKVNIDGFNVVERDFISRDLNLQSGYHYNGNLFYYAKGYGLPPQMSLRYIVEISDSSLEVTDTLNLPQDYAMIVFIENKCYAASYYSTIDVIDLDTLSLTTTVPTSEITFQFFYLAITSENYIYYISSHYFVKFDTTDNTYVEKNITEPDVFSTGFISGNFLYLYSWGSVLKINLITFSENVEHLNISSVVSYDCYTSIVIGSKAYLGCYYDTIVEINLLTFTHTLETCIDSVVTTLTINDENQLIVGGNDLTGNIYLVDQMDQSLCGNKIPTTTTTTGGTSGGDGGTTISTGAIIGIIIGGIVLLLIIILIAYIVIKRRR